jgi:hypothetical protein
MDKKYKSILTLRQLQDDKYYLAQNDSELSELIEYLGIDGESINLEEFTGAVLLIGEGDYIAVWMTESSAWYSLDAIYHPLPYYQSKEESEEYLPEYWKRDNSEYQF